MVVGIFLTLCILLTTVVSKSTLLLITSSIYKNATLYCVELPGGRQFSSCSRVYPDDVKGTIYKLSQNVQVIWVLTSKQMLAYDKSLRTLKEVLHSSHCYGWKSLVLEVPQPKNNIYKKNHLI